MFAILTIAFMEFVVFRLYFTLVHFLALVSQVIYFWSISLAALLRS